MINPTFRNINGLFVLSFKNDNDPVKGSFDKYCMSLEEIKDFNALIDNKPFFDQPMKNKREAYEKPANMSRNYDYTIGNLSDYKYHQNCDKLVRVALSRQTNTSIPQKVNLTEKLEDNGACNNVFIAEKEQKLF